ncbi:lysophospholipid acyltransferase family protein [Virgibacillus kekensis]|uniref:1-acyl-sn-glycerol-3-phosphate acyltransferase n=1 Tax=Virgibacillus kekensis TaxID=202261 RepID=A0ABV9DDG4_9BACI
MIRSIPIYIYAILVVVWSAFKLPYARKLAAQQSGIQNKEKIFDAPKQVSQKIIKRTGTEVYVRGEEKLPDGAFLLVANHQGLFDILALIGYLGRPIGFIAKKELEKVPVVSSWMGLMKGVFIDRKDRRQAVKAIGQGIKNLENGHPLVIFPEGTRSRGKTLSNFKSGSLRLATKAGVPIVPVAIDGTYQMLEEDSGRVKASTIRMTIGEPVYREYYHDKKHGELAQELQAEIESMLFAEEEQKIGNRIISN